MDSVFASLNFKFKWRDYQKRILENLEEYLSDRKLHIVAAPGSGKTVLGLEVMRRIAKPTLIFAPSIVIRNQWVDRLTTMFMDDGPPPQWISRNIRQPATVTIVTYQALHAAVKGIDLSDEEEEALEGAEEEEVLDASSIEKRKMEDGVSDSEMVIDALKSIGVKTVVLDEAHHLRKEWWKVLTKTLESFDDPVTVCLTATPPYDVSFAEWQKYHELCGSIDEEISVPELVKVKDLCPHQDYIYFSRPVKHEADQLEEFQKSLSDFVKALSVDEKFSEILRSHPWFKNPQGHMEEILSDPVLFSTGLLFLHHTGFEVPREWLNILGLRQRRIPTLNMDSLESLLSETIYLKNKEFVDHDEHLKGLEKTLQRMGAIERRKITIQHPKKLKKILASSVSKLESIIRIVSIEKRAMKSDLRMVILTDFIRKSDFPKNSDDIKPLNNLGVIPIFEALRREHLESTDFHLGVLTGSLIIIPVSAQKTFEEVSVTFNIQKTSITFKSLEHDHGYLVVSIQDVNKHVIVSLMTECFARGAMQVMVGTAALLGEGWDAPALNSLVLASYVGSFMLSNQMRGRAIRKNPKVSDKVSNIWHLSAIDPFKPKNVLDYLVTQEQKVHTRRYLSEEHFYFENMGVPLGEDFETLKRRFLTFEAPSLTGPPLIENGIRRFGLSEIDWTSPNQVESVNQRMEALALDRVTLTKRWKALLGKSIRPSMVEKIKSLKAPGVFISNKTIAALFAESVAILLAGSYAVLSSLGRRPDLAITVSMAVFVVLLAIPTSFKALRLILKNGSMEGRIKQLAMALLETLHQSGLVKTRLNLLKVKSDVVEGGFVVCTLEGGSTHEK